MNDFQLRRGKKKGKRQPSRVIVDRARSSFSARGNRVCTGARIAILTAVGIVIRTLIDLRLTIPREHDQTAFSFGLVWDWAGVAGDTEMRELLGNAAQRFYQSDRNCPLNYEPSGQDFLSPCLAEADFMRRVLTTQSFRDWLTDFLPGIPHDPATQWLPPGVVTDRADPKLAHIDGLNLSRAWMLEGIAHGLGRDDRRSGALLAAANSHRQAALPEVTGEHYEGGHWLGTFAVYLTSHAGL